MEKAAGYVVAVGSRVVVVAWISTATVKTIARVSVAAVSGSSAGESARCCAAMKGPRRQNGGRGLARGGRRAPGRVRAANP